MGSASRKLATLFMGFALCASAQIVEPTTAATSGNTASPSTVYYFAASGSDSNACTISLPCVGQTKFETLATTGNATILFNRGDYFPWSSFGVHNRLTTTSTTTYATNPLAGQNITIDAYGTGDRPTFEGADILPSTFTLFDSASSTYVYSYTPGALYAENIFVDKKGIDSAATGHLLNEPNFPAVTYPTGGNVYPGQAIISGSRTYVIGGLGPISTDPATSKDGSRAFPPAEADTSKTGVQNVEAIPGSTYNDTQAGKLYVHLLDGSNPNTHIMQASTRKVGLLCEGCNGWLVQNVRFEKYVNIGAFFTNYSTATATNGYYTNVNDQVNQVQAWDNTSELKYYYLGQSNTAIIFAAQIGINMLANSSAYTDFAAYGTKLTNSTLGRGGSIPGNEDGGSAYLEALIQGYNSPEVGNNTGVSYMHNGLSVRYNTNAWIHDNTLEGQNRGCVLCWANNTGALVERNSYGYGAGDAAQGGGTSVCTGTWDYTGHPELDVPGATPCIFRLNKGHDFGVSTNLALYNCSDNNTNAIVKNMLFDGNTFVNCDSAAISFEVISGSTAGAGITDVTFRNNLISQHKNYPVYTDRTGVQGVMNNSNAIYFAVSTAPGVNGFFHSYNNVIQIGSNTVMAAHATSTCANFFTSAAVNDPTSQCIANTSDPIFTDITNGVYTLKAFSPGINRPVVGQNVGALGIDYTPVFGGRYGGYLNTGGSAIRFSGGVTLPPISLVVLKANLPTGSGAGKSNYGYNVLPGSKRQVSVNLANGTANTVNWTVANTTGGATATLDRSTNAPGVVNVTLGNVGSSCSISGSLGSYAVNSAATVTVRAQSVDDITKTADFLFKVCAPTTTVKVSPGYQQAYIGQPVELQSFVVGNTNEAGTWTVSTNPGTAGSIVDNNKRDTVFSATATGRYVLTYTSAVDSSKSSTAIVYVSGAQPSYGLVTANLTMSVPCAADPAFAGSVYEVGPTQTFKTINSVPLTTWVPGSIIRVHNEDTTGTSPTTYHEGVRTGVKGTLGQPLMLCGVPDATGHLPVIDGSNSTSSSNNNGSQQYGVVNIWGPNDTNGLYVNGSNGGDHTIVSGLRIMDGRNTFQYVDVTSGSLTNFDDFCSGIRVKSGQFISLIGNDVDNNGNGIFVQNNSAGGWSQTSGFITIRGNRIRNAGISGGPGINNSGSHGIYTQAYYPVVEENRLESLVLNSGGDLIKDRGLESIHRYNYAVTTDGGYLVGMESATDAEPYHTFEPWLGQTGETSCSNAIYCAYENSITPDQVAAYQESLEKIFMYGNIYSSRSNQFLANFKLADSGGGVGFDNPNISEMSDHLGTTYFYSNTVDNPPFAVFGTLSGGNNGTDPVQQPMKPSVFVANNIFYLAKTGSISIFSLTRNASIIGKWQTNLFNKGTVDNTLPINGMTATNVNTVSGWQNWNDALQYPGVFPINGHNLGITTAGTGNFLETDTQNHQPYNPVTFAPVSGAGATGIGTTITDPVASLLPVRFQYAVESGAIVARTASTTVGAVDTGNQPTLSSLAMRSDAVTFLKGTGTCNYGPAGFDYPGSCLPSRLGYFATPIPLRVLGTYSDGYTIDVSPNVFLSNADLTFFGNSAFNTARDYSPLSGFITGTLGAISLTASYATDGATAP